MRKSGGLKNTSNISTTTPLTKATFKEENMHFLIVLLVIGYFWLLAKKVAKPKSFKPGALWLQLLAWAWAIFFGVWVVGWLVSTTRTASGDTSGQITVLIL